MKKIKCESVHLKKTKEREEKQVGQIKNKSEPVKKKMCVKRKRHLFPKLLNIEKKNAEF